MSLYVNNWFHEEKVNQVLFLLIIIVQNTCVIHDLLYARKSHRSSLSTNVLLIRFVILFIRALKYKLHNYKCYYSVVYF